MTSHLWEGWLIAQVCSNNFVTKLQKPSPVKTLLQLSFRSKVSRTTRYLQITLIHHLVGILLVLFQHNIVLQLHERSCIFPECFVLLLTAFSGSLHLQSDKKKKTQTAVIISIVGFVLHTNDIKRTPPTLMWYSVVMENHIIQQNFIYKALERFTKTKELLKFSNTGGHKK